LIAEGIRRITKKCISNEEQSLSRIEKCFYFKNRDWQAKV